MSRARRLPVFSMLTQDEAEQSAQEWLLWPATAARVVIPVRQTRTLDLFERVVLELCVAAPWDNDRVDEAAGALHLDRLLILYVLSQLQRQHLLDQKFRPTPRGEAAAAELLVREQELRVAMVYQAPWSGRVWPRIVTGQPVLVEAKWRGEVRASLAIGSAGRPVRRDAVVVDGSWDAREVLDRDIREALEQRTIEDVLSSSVAEFELDGSRLERLSLASSGEPVLLAAPLWVIDADGTPGVRDPVTGLPEEELWQLLQEIKETCPPLRDLVGASDPARLAPSEPLPVLAADTALAEQRVRERIGDWVTRSELWPRCVELERAVLAVELSSDGDRPERIRSVITEAQALLESLFQTVLSAFPCPDAAASILPVDRKDKAGANRNREYMEDRARQFGATVPYDIAVQGRGLLDDALTRGRHTRASLRALAGAALLAAARVVGHPFGEALRRKPDLLAAIDTVADLRNKGAHASAVPLTKLDAQRAVAIANEAVGLVRTPAAAPVRVLEPSLP